MPKAPKTAKISAVVNSGELSAEGLRFEMDVNSFPVVRCSTKSPTEDAVAAPVSAETLARIAQMQEDRLAGVTEPNVEIEADDGVGGSMTFEGFLAAPVLQISKVNTIDQFSAVGKEALMDSLDLSIYRAGYVTSREETGGATDLKLKPIPAADTGNVTSTIAAVTDILVENYDVSVLYEEYPVSKELMGLRHEVNTNGPLAIWKEVLENSSVTFESWEEAFKLCNYLGVRLSERVKETLTAKTPGFWNKLRALMAEFQMFYVPSFDGVGRLVRADQKVADPEVDLEVSISGLSVADGSSRLLQPGGVTMMGPAAKASRPEAEANPRMSRVIAYAPDPLRPGFIQEEVPPFWLLDHRGVPIMGSELDESALPATEETKLDLSLAKRAKRQTEGYKYKAEVDLASAGIMTELCEVIFKEIQLASSTAVLTLPLDFSVNADIGKRARVKVLAGENGEDSSFTAFLSGVTHSVDLRQGKVLNSSTQVRCTHVKYGDE